MADVFISYSHRDQPFALQLVGALVQRDYTTWFDKDDVFPAGEFREDIKAGIEEASAFIFVLSPDSLDSEECGKELTYAEACGKKLIPVLHRPIDPSHVPQSLRDLDWIEDVSFDRLLEKILEALQTDKDDWKQAGRWLRSGSEWKKDHKRNAGLLLYGRELRNAEEWLKKTERWRLNGIDKKPQPLPLHIQFIHESRRVANRLLLVRIITLVLFVSLSAGGVFALFYHDPTRVSTLQDNNSPGSLRYAVNRAPAKSTITFDKGVRGTILLTGGDLAIANELTIRGPGASLLSISGGKSGSVVRVAHGGNVTISGLAFKNSNTSTGFIDNGGTLHLTDSIISGNTSKNETSAAFAGGGISNHGTLTVSNSTISGNTSTHSVGGIFNEGRLTVSNSIISGNTAGALSGGMLNSGIGALTVNNSIISGNTSYGAGGGIYNYGVLKLNNSTILDNKTSAGSTGGGIFNVGYLTLSNSTVSGNMSGEGGGITNEGSVAMINSTVAGNTSREGSGIFFEGYIGTDGPIKIYSQLFFSTIYGNTASVGGDIAIQDFDFNTHKLIKQIISVVQVIGSIVAGNPAHPGPDVVGMLRSFGYNVFQDNSGATFDPSTQTLHSIDKTLSGNDLTRLFADPVGLRNNGGPTMTYALRAGSPALDTVPYQYCHLTDQRGVKRPDGNEQFCDIGAYEYSDATSTTPIAPTQATATAQVIANNPYPAYLPGKGTLAFVDPLSKQEGSQWSSGRNPDTGAACEFTGGAYHVTQPHNGYFRYCDAKGIFSNFAFEVQMTITQGDCGGMMLGDDNNGNYDQLELCQDGRYWVYKYATGSSATTLDSGRSSAMRTGPGQQNKIAVVAQGSTLHFYVNEQQLDQVQDTSDTVGLIDLIAREHFGHVTDVAYTNARAWTL